MRLPAQALGSLPVPVIVVFDGGVDHGHPDLDGAMWTHPGEVAGDGFDNDGNGVVDDVHGFNVAHGTGELDTGTNVAHGTHVAGLIAAEDNGVGITGLAAGRVQLLGIAGVYDAADPLDAFEKAVAYVLRLKREHRADVRVVNASFGGEYPLPQHQDRWRAALQALADADILVVTPTSNEYGRDMNDVPHFPSSAGLPNVISVAGLNSREDGLAYSSSRGSRVVDLAAPSSFLETTHPGGGTTLGQGNSLAAPLVAAAAGVLLARDPTLSATRVRELLLASARPLPALQGKVRTGAKLDLEAALAQLGA
jgi:subtilisin family serine protease